MKDIIIRKAEKKDVSDILILIKELAAFEDGLHLVTLDEKELMKFGFSSEKMYDCYVAEVNGKIYGLAFYFYTFSTWNGRCLYLEDLIVSRKNRTKGMGSALMDKIIQTGKMEDVNRISWQVLDWNLDAQDFYRKFDADLDEEWINGRLTKAQIKAYKVK